MSVTVCRVLVVSQWTHSVLETPMHNLLLLWLLPCAVSHSAPAVLGLWHAMQTLHTDFCQGCSFLHWEYFLPLISLTNSSSFASLITDAFSATLFIMSSTTPYFFFLCVGSIQIMHPSLHIVYFHYIYHATPQKLKFSKGRDCFCFVHCWAPSSTSSRYKAYCR